MLRPTGKNLLVKLTEQETVSEAGIEIPKEQKSPDSGTLMSIGDKCELDWSIGDKLHFVRFEGHSITHEGVDYKLITEDLILAKECMPNEYLTEEN